MSERRLAVACCWLGAGGLVTGSAPGCNRLLEAGRLAQDVGNPGVAHQDAQLLPVETHRQSRRQNREGDAELERVFAGDRLDGDREARVIAVSVDHAGDVVEASTQLERAPRAVFLEEMKVAVARHLHASGFEGEELFCVGTTHPLSVVIFPRFARLGLRWRLV